MLLAIQELDKVIFIWSNQFQSRLGLRRLFRFISLTGDGYMYVAISLIAFFSDETLGEIFFLTALLAFAFEMPLFTILKNIIKRERPYIHIEGAHTIITPVDKFSLPSGHTAAAFLMATLLFIHYPIFSLASFIWASLIGISRVMIGVHYPTDILVGACLGVSCACLSSIILL